MSNQIDFISLLQFFIFSNFFQELHPEVLDEFVLGNITIGKHRKVYVRLFLSKSVDVGPVSRGIYWDLQKGNIDFLQQFPQIFDCAFKVVYLNFGYLHLLYTLFHVFR